MEWFRFVLGTVFIIIGLVIFCAELFGVFRMKYVLNRMHAAAMGDTMGIGACMVGLMLISGANSTTLKMALMLVALWFTSPVASHLLAKLEITTNEDLAKEAEIIDDLSVINTTGGEEEV